MFGTSDIQLTLIGNDKEDVMNIAGPLREARYGIGLHINNSKTSTMTV